MAVYSGFFNSINGDRRYNAHWFALFFSTLIGNGVFPNPSTGLQVVENEQLQTTVKPGRGWINGYFVVNDSDFTIEHDLSDGVLSRIDRIVLRLNYQNRLIEVALKKGENSSNPTAPNLQRDGSVYELALADVYIGPGATQIKQSNITDLRLNKNLCGIVHGLVDQVDTSTIFNQYQSWYEQMTGSKLDEFNNWTSQRRQEFEDWLVQIQGILNEDMAGNLLLLIQQNQIDIRSLIKNKTDVLISVNAWVYNDMTDRYEYTIYDSDITESSVVDVNIKVDYLDEARMLLSACTSGDGFVTLYASSIPDVDLIADYRITGQVI